MSWDPWETGSWLKIQSKELNYPRLRLSTYQWKSRADRGLCWGVICSALVDSVWSRGRRGWTEMRGGGVPKTGPWLGSCQHPLCPGSAWKRQSSTWPGVWPIFTSCEWCPDQAVFPIVSWSWGSDLQLSHPPFDFSSGLMNGRNLHTWGMQTKENWTSLWW